MSQAELIDNLGTRSPPSGSTTQSIQLELCLVLSLLVQLQQEAPIILTQRPCRETASGSSDILGTASPPSAFTKQSSYSASDVSIAEFTGSAPTRISGKDDDLSKYTQFFGEIFYRELLFHLISSRNFLSRNFQSYGLFVGNYTISAFSENFA